MKKRKFAKKRPHELVTLLSFSYYVSFPLFLSSLLSSPPLSPTKKKQQKKPHTHTLSLSLAEHTKKKKKKKNATTPPPPHTQATPASPTPTIPPHKTPVFQLLFPLISLLSVSARFDRLPSFLWWCKEKRTKKKEKNQTPPQKKQRKHLPTFLTRDPSGKTHRR